MEAVTDTRALIELFEIVGSVCGILAFIVSLVVKKVCDKAVEIVGKETFIDKIVKRIKDKQL